MIINIALSAFISLKVCLTLITYYKYFNKNNMLTNYNGININNYKEH